MAGSKSIEDFISDVPEMLQPIIAPALDDLREVPQIRQWFTCESNCIDNLALVMEPHVDSIFSIHALSMLLRATEYGTALTDQEADTLRWVSALWSFNRNGNLERQRWLLQFTRAVAIQFQKEFQ